MQRMKTKPGPPKLYPERVIALLGEGVISEIDEVRVNGESRAEFMRRAVRRELARRNRRK